MAASHKPSTPPEPDLSYGEIIIRCEEVRAPGQRPVLVPKIEITNIGKLSSGWFNQHINLFLREIGRAQVIQRTGRTPNTTGAE